MKGTRERETLRAEIQGLLSALNMPSILEEALKYEIELKEKANARSSSSDGSTDADDASSVDWSDDGTDSASAGGLNSE